MPSPLTPLPEVYFSINMKVSSPGEGEKYKTSRFFKNCRLYLDLFGDISTHLPTSSGNFTLPS